MQQIFKLQYINVDYVAVLSSNAVLPLGMYLSVNKPAH